MRLLVGLAALSASTLACGQAGQSPYVLRIDRTPYLLEQAYRTPESASAGASRGTGQLAMTPPTSSPSFLAGQVVESRVRQYEYRIRDLERERDAWRQRAEMLEAERQGALRGLIALPPPYLGR